jgi:prolyl oligopeptidase
LRVAKGSTAIEEVTLPVKGHISDAFADPRAPGLSLELASWVMPADIYAYRPDSKSFSALKIGTRGDIDSSAYVVSDLEAPALDGVKVPLSLIERKGTKGPQITLLEAYGAYGISQLADFSTRRAAAMSQGITYAICHVRGGGELGEAWRLGGKDANKHNTWEDLVACGEHLTARGTTARSKLFIMGGSAGGITMGRAFTSRPDLFAGVLDMVPDANLLRAEFMPGGPANIPEFGTITTEAGFNNLYEMDTIAHIKKGAQYPAVLITTGLNDPRVSPWEPAKLAAALEASGSSRPVLLRIDQEAGHGMGSTKTQTDSLAADGIAFIFWQAGLPEWQPQ